MAELERARVRERTLEQALAKIAGDHWQVRLPFLLSSSCTSANVSIKTVLDIAPPSSAVVVARTMGSSLLNRAVPTPASGQSSDPPSAASQASIDATLSQMEQIRLLVLGMEQRIQDREEKLTKTVERAEAQEVKCEALRKEVLPTKIAT